MGFLARAVGERKSVSFDKLWDQILTAGFLSKAGPSVTLDNAFKVGALFACIRVLAQGVAQVPFKLHRETRAEGAALPTILPARDHYLYDKLACQPNARTTSFEFRETLTMHAALGNGYAFKNIVGGKIHELILLNPGRVEKVEADDFSVSFNVTGKSGEVKPFPAEAIWHVRGPSWDGMLGVDVLKIAREALGLSIATEESHAKLHSKGVRPSGIYSVDGTLSPDQYKQLKAWIEKEFAGAENSGAPMILDRAAKWLPQSMTGIDSQHLETRKYQLEEVARFCGVNPIMIFAESKNTTYASAEQMFLAHVVHALMPWYARIEQSADVHLLTAKERAEGLYFKFLAAGLLRGDLKATAEYLYRLTSIGIMDRDEARAKLEMNPRGGDFAIPLTPVNMTADPLSAAKDDITTP